MESTSQLASGLQWLGGGLVILLTAFGAGSIILAVINRFWTRKDKREAVHETNQTSHDQKEVSLVDILTKRVDALEAKIEKQADQLMALTKSEATLTSDNSSLRRELDRKNQEIQSLQQENNHRAGRISVLEREVAELKDQIQQLLAIQRGEM